MVPDYLPCTIITNLVAKTFSPSFVLTDICNCLIIQSGEEGNRRGGDTPQFGTSWGGVRGQGGLFI